MKHVLILICFVTLMIAVTILVFMENTSPNFDMKLRIAEMLTYIGMICGLIWFGLIVYQLYKEENSD